jgi:class 3 adenylate cyclase/tetratricopeptide (TPR) repeat protein
VSSAARFCAECGYPLAPVADDPRFASPKSYTPQYLVNKILTTRKAIEGERKQVTVLFADIKGSMELLADRDPEDAQKLLGPILERMIEAVHYYEGTVSRVMGDGVFALFGAPLAHEDHAVRACYAALRMQESVTRYAGEMQRLRGVEVSIRIGLNSGEILVCAVGNDLHMDYTVVGQTVNLAARIEQTARPGTIRMTANTLRLAEGYVAAEQLGLTPVKGLAAPVPVYELTGPGAARTRLQVSAGRGLTKFVDREAEMAALQDALALAGTGHGQVLSLVGEPGIGKSRLLYEFVHSPQTADWLILESGAAPPGKAPPGFPVIELLKSYFMLADKMDGGEIRAAVTAKLLGIDLALAPLVTPLLGMLDAAIDDPEWAGLDPPHRLRRTLDAVVQLLVRESELRPLIVVFDDVQSYDSLTQLLIDQFVDRLRRAHILLLLSHRPEYQHGWDGKGYHRRLRLDALPDNSGYAMLEALLGKDARLRPPKELVLARTEGNPFFIEESVRTLVETGVLSGTRGAYQLEREPRVMEVPATVEAVLAARIDRLPASEKRLLQCAAVVGKDVPMAVLRAIADVPEEALGRGLAALQAAEFLYVGRFFPDPEYTFKHALTHQVAYGSLLHDRRRLLHRRIVEALQLAHPDPGADQVELLAHHSFSGEMWEETVRHCRRAGLTAASRPAHREAVTRFERALEALEHLPDSRQRTEAAIDIRFDLRNSLHPLGHLERLLDHIRKAEALAIGLGDRRRLGRASSFLCQYHRLMGDLAAAVPAGERAMTIGRELDDLSLSIVATTHFGPTLAARGDHRPAAEILTANVNRLRGDLAGDVMGTTGILSVFSRSYLACSLAELGQFALASRHAEEAIRLAQNSGHVYSLASGYYGAGTVLALKGDVAASIEVLERGLELCRSWHLLLLLPLFGISLGHAYCQAARPYDAIGLLQEAEREARVMHRIGGHSMLMVRLGEAHLQALRRADAERCAREAVSLACEHSERGHECYAFRLLGELGLTDAPDLDDSERFFRQGIARSEELERRPLAAQCHFGLGRRLRRVGRQNDARSHLDAAAELFATLDMTFWLERARAESAALA